MHLEDIKDEKLARRVKAANNTGGTICEDMWLALRDSKSEMEFEEKWMWRLRNEINRQIGFHNDLAEELGYRKYLML